MTTSALSRAPRVDASSRVTSRFANITPNWYAAVMGTGIVATAGATLGTQLPGQHLVATGFWLLATVLLVIITAATAVHWVRHREVASQHHLDPVMAHFYGAPPMALLTVGAGTLLLGKDLVGTPVAVGIDWVLWTVGTVLGLVTTFVIPYLSITRLTGSPGDPGPFGGWLMPVVPPMVSAATGALLLPHLPPGPSRVALLLACYCFFGLSLIASVVVITLIWARLAGHGVGPAILTPTLFIVLGPVGQSVTAANLLGGNAHLAIPAPYSTALQAFGVVYGVPAMGFAALWAVRAGARTIRAARTQLPFALTWWSFTFPIGTCVTGLTGLAVHTGSGVASAAADAAYGVLLVAWTTVATRTVRGVLSGALLAPRR